MRLGYQIVFLRDVHSNVPSELSEFPLLRPPIKKTIEQQPFWQTPKNPTDPSIRIDLSLGKFLILSEAEATDLDTPSRKAGGAGKSVTLLVGLGESNPHSTLLGLGRFRSRG